MKTFSNIHNLPKETSKLFHLWFDTLFLTILNLNFNLNPAPIFE